MVETTYKYSIQMKIERGLQAQLLADVLTTITDCAQYIRDYPFPNFVHNVLYKLAQAFQGEVFGRKFEHSLNTIRLRIVTALRECSSSLGVAFSSEEIVRCIMKVSHSNDYKARSLTLLALASLAPLIFDDKKVHNLVIESLDCIEPTELTAAIQAANELAKCSIPFSALVLCKTGELLNSSKTDHSAKFDLLGIVANLRDLSLAENCVQLGRALLETAEHKLCIVIYNSLTKLACRSEHIVQEQIILLLNGLSKAIAQRDIVLIHCILVNLAQLATFPRYWHPDHVRTIRDCYTQIEELNSKSVLCALLHCLEVLSSSKQHNQILQEKHEWISLLSSSNEDLILRIFAIKLALNLAMQGGDEDPVKQLRSAIFSAIIETVRVYQNVQLSNDSKLQSNQNIRLKFFSLVSKFVRSNICTASLAYHLANILLGNGEQHLFNNVFDKSTMEILAVICDTYWSDCQALVFASLSDAISTAHSLSEVPITAFPLLLSATPTTCYSTCECPLAPLVTRICSSQELDHWRIYQIARSALRYGHWRQIALPLLKQISGSTENLETKSWMMALIYVAQSQLSTFSIEELQRAEGNLQCAALYLKALVSSQKDQPFSFAADYTSSLLSLLRSVRFLLATIDVELSSSGDHQLQSADKSSTAITEELAAAQKNFADVRQQWVTLCSKSFDADTQTLLQMALLIRICLLLEQYLDFLAASKRENPILNEIKIEDLGECTQNSMPSAQTRNLFSLLCWAREEMRQFHADGSRPDLRACLQMLRMLRELLKHLMDFPLELPRFFFQRVQHTKIKLIISPQATDSRGIYRVSSLDLLPVIIEGVIESNNTKPIETVCVVLTLRRDNTAPTEKRQHIQLEQNDKYFKAQFLLKLVHQKATKISAKVYFVDSVTKKQWFDESDTAALTVEVADGAH